MSMEAGLESNMSQHRDHPQPPFSLPIGSTRSYVHSLSKGLVFSFVLLKISLLLEG